MPTVRDTFPRMPLGAHSTQGPAGPRTMTGRAIPGMWKAGGGREGAGCRAGTPRGTGRQASGHHASCQGHPDRSSMSLPDESRAVSRAGSRVQTDGNGPEKLAAPLHSCGCPSASQAGRQRGLLPGASGQGQLGSGAGAAQGKDTGPPRGATAPGLLPSPAWGALPGPQDSLARGGARSLVPPPSPEPAVTAALSSCGDTGESFRHRLCRRTPRLCWT